MEFDVQGNLFIPKRDQRKGRILIGEGRSFKIGRAGNGIEKPRTIQYSDGRENGPVVIPSEDIFVDSYLSDAVSSGQLTITAEKGVFKVVSHGTNPTNILVNREQQPKEELRQLTEQGPEAQGEPAQSLKVPPEVGLTTPERHPVPLDTARQEVLEALNPSEPKAVIDKTTSGANNPENDSDMAALPESAEVSERTIINLTPRRIHYLGRCHEKL